MSIVVSRESGTFPMCSFRWCSITTVVETSTVLALANGQSMGNGHALRLCEPENMASELDFLVGAEGLEPTTTAL